MHETAEYQTPESFFSFFFSLKPPTSLSEMRSRSPNGTRRKKKHKPLSWLPGNKPQAPEWIFKIFLFSFVRCGRCLGPAWQRRVPAGAGGLRPGAGPPAPETGELFLRRARDNAAVVREGARSAGPGPLFGRARQTPTGGPTLLTPAPRGADLSSPRRPSPALRSPRPAPSANRAGTCPPPPCRRPLRAGAGAREPDETPRGPAEPARAPRNSPGPGGPLGIIPSRVRRSALAAGADACAPALFGRPITAAAAAESREAAAAAGAAGGAGGAGRGCPSAESPPAVAATAAQAREPSAAQEGAGDHVPRERPQLTRAARTIRSAAEGAGSRKSKHFDRKSES